jgi:putative FmdB family regulatory protein
MPIYEYRCDGCGAEFEKLVARAADSATVECPTCGQQRLTQKFSTFSAVMGGARASDGPACASAGGCPNRGMCGMG